MRFCPRCGNLLIAERRGKTGYLVCRKCGYREKSRKKILVKERVLEEKRRVIVMGKGEELAELPITKTVCPNCGNEEAYWWMQQTRAADEPPTLFYRCKKCGYTWRSYG